MDDHPEESGDNDGAGCPVVGIGSSAGGVAALQAFFDAVAKDMDAAFVLVPHLDPTKASMMTDVIAKHTDMPVKETENGDAIEAGHVYVIPPDRYITIDGDTLHIHEPGEARGHRRAIDVFFRSLAEAKGPRGVAVVLSGTGSHGAQGLREVKAAGGLALAQDPESAEYAGMPQAAIATGVVDFALDPGALPEAVSRFLRHPYVDRPGADEALEENGRIETILALVRTHANHDFRDYKRKTLQRRIHRRMGLTGAKTLDDYLERLRDDKAEAQQLARDLMINVTAFFRDADAWEAFANQVAEPLVEGYDGERQIRAWVAGCSTGEEAYSLAILLLEAGRKAGTALDIKIFASDTGKGVLETAREGLYSAEAVADLSQERLDAFFVKEDSTYRVKKELREAVVFAEHNLLRDPPFTRLDIVTCRNLLIYFEPRVQKKLISLFHFGLRENCTLFLGSAETIQGKDDLFSPISKKWRLFRRIGKTRHDIVDFPIADSGQITSGETHKRKHEVDSLSELAESTLLDLYAPAAVVVDRRLQVRFYHGETERFLRQPGGEPTNDLSVLARKGLTAKLRAIVQRAFHEKERKTIWARLNNEDGGAMTVEIAATPLSRRADGEALVLAAFQLREATAWKTEETVEAGSPSEAELERENRELRAELRDTVEQMESSNEELKASNEEITSINEELQSTNEELVTSKEELQSLNEELNTVNAQLQAKVEELEDRTNDLNNLLTSTSIATLFLDRDLKIRWFSPAMKQLMDIIPSDVGRPVSHFRHRFGDSRLVDRARDVLDNLSADKSEIQSEDGRWFLRRILPYRTEDDRIEGVVVTFIDINHIKRAQEELREAKDYAEIVIDSVHHPLVMLGKDRKLRSANRAFFDIYGLDPETAQGQRFSDLAEGAWDTEDLDGKLAEVASNGDRFTAFEVEQEFPGAGSRAMRIDARRISERDLILLSILDITERKRHERRQKLLMSELSHRVKNALNTVQAIANQTLRHSTSAEEFADRFRARLQALARGHDLVVASDWRGARFEDLARRLLAPYLNDDDAQVSIDCPDTHLSPETAMSFALVLHELTTNAAKYGALSTPKGQVEVSCTPSADNETVRFVWRERGGPKVEPPGHKGFGSRLIERAAESELNGQSRLSFDPEGVECVLVVPRDQILSGGEESE